MRRSFLWIKILLGASVLLAGMAAIQQAIRLCDACTTTLRLPVAPVGMVFYGLLFAVALLSGPVSTVFLGIAVAFGVHGTLVTHMIVSGQFCLLCSLTAANSVALVALSIVHDRRNIQRLAWVLPVTALTATVPLSWGMYSRPDPSALGGHVRAHRQESVGTIQITIFEKPACPYCVELREKIVPRLIADFQAGIEITYRDASEMPGISRTPTVVITPPEGKGEGRIIEGLPSYEMLREAIARKES